MSPKKCIKTKKAKKKIRNQKMILRKSKPDQQAQKVDKIKSIKNPMIEEELKKKKK